jgi:hypothetical protein
VSTLSTKKWRFIPTMVDDAPMTRGVFALWANDELVYLGHAAGGAVTIHSRLFEQLAKRVEDDPKRATHYSWELCANPAEREKQLMGLLGYVHREEPKTGNAS